MTARAGFDAAIVGGGILGTATAYHLAAAGARTLLTARDGAGMLYLDRVSTAGTLLVAAPDVFVHLGTTANPISARFLDGFLPWVVEELL